VKGIQINGAAEAALALEPLAGRFATVLFGVGLLNASLLAASILPLATSYTVCEAFGWEAGVDRSWREAPIFHSLYLFAIVFGAVVALIPGLPLFAVMVFSQDVNGVLLAIVLLFALRIASDRRVMGQYANGRLGNTIAWITSVGLIVLSALLIVSTAAPLLGLNF
jgi:Mn2+/Fe2+ NRAMP family transporter